MFIYVFFISQFTLVLFWDLTYFAVNMQTVTIFNKLLILPIRKRIFQWQKIRKLSSNGEKVIMRPLLEKDIPEIIDIRRYDNFPDAVSKYLHCIKFRPDSITVGESEEGKVISCFGMLQNSDDVTTACFRSTHKDYRSFGFGQTILEKLFDDLGDKMLIGNSEVNSFAWNIKYVPIIEKDFITIDYDYNKPVNPWKFVSNIPHSIKIERFKDSDLQAILEYDFSIMGYKRDILVTLNCRDPFGKTFAAFSGSKCVGYGSINLNIQGYGKVGPLYADDPAIAEALLRELLMSFEFRSGLGVTAVSNNVYSNMIFGKLGKLRSTPVIRSYRRKRFVVDTKNIYALFDNEIEPF